MLYDLHIYRPQRSCGQGNIFTGVCLSTGGGACLSACWDAIPPSPLGWRTPRYGEPPPDGEPPWMENPPGMENPPRWRTPLGWRTPPDGEPPRMETPPDGEPPLGWRTPPMENPPPPTPPGWRNPPPPGSRHQHTVYERPVRILLECILVLASMLLLCQDHVNFLSVQF